MVIKCKSKRHYICQNCLVCKNEFACTVTGKHIKWEVSYIVLLLMWFTWSVASYVRQYVGSAFKDNFKPRLGVRKSDVITGK